MPSLTLSPRPWCANRLVGIISLPLFFAVVPALLAVAFGWISVRPGAGRRWPMLGLVGIGLGLLSLAGAAMAWVLW